MCNLSNESVAFSHIIHLYLESQSFPLLKNFFPLYTVEKNIVDSAICSIQKITIYMYILFRMIKFSTTNLNVIHIRQ